MIANPEPTAAVHDRANWQPVHDDVALYARPGATISVRVQRVHQPTRREQHMASVIRDGQATHTMPFATAADAVVL
jgi:hypothetical protein